MRDVDRTTSISTMISGTCAGVSKHSSIISREGTTTSSNRDLFADEAIGMFDRPTSLRILCSSLCPSTERRAPISRQNLGIAEAEMVVANLHENNRTISKSQVAHKRRLFWKCLSRILTQSVLHRRLLRHFCILTRRITLFSHCLSRFASMKFDSSRSSGSSPERNQ